MSVTPERIAVATGLPVPDLDSTQDMQWQMWIDDAAMLIETRRVQLNVDPIDEAKLDYVIREAVVAQVKRPDDATQVTISVDDGATSKTYRSGAGRVQILDEWWVLLGLTDPKGAYSVDQLGPDSVHLPWCALNFGGTYCSCGVDIAGYPIFEGPDW